MHASPADGNVSGYRSAVGGLDFLWLELTDKCNLACVHCYAESSPLLPLFHHMQTPDWKRALLESYEAGCRKVQFIGGEPTIYPHLIELIRYSRELGYELVEVFTNGTVFTSALKETFRRFHVHLAFSVYADSASIHDSITLQAGSFSKTVQSIEWALRNGLPVRVAITAMDQNLSAIHATRKLFQELGVDEIRIDRRRGVGRGSVAKESTPSFDELCGSCSEGKLCIAPTGDIFPCVFSRSWIVGTAAEGVQATLDGRRLFEFRDTMRTRLQCDSTDCAPAQEPVPFCGPDQKCNPDGSANSLRLDYADREKCNPTLEQKTCGPARHSADYRGATQR